MPARRRLDELVTRLVNKDAGRLFARPEERWPSFSHEKGWRILAPFYTTSVDVAASATNRHRRPRREDRQHRPAVHPA